MEWDTLLSWLGPCEGLLAESREGMPAMIGRSTGVIQVQDEGGRHWQRHVKSTALWGLVFHACKIDRHVRREVTSISVHLWFFNVNEYGILGVAFPEDRGPLSSGHTQVMAEGRATRLFRVYSKTDLIKCPMAVTDPA